MFQQAPATLPPWKLSAEDRRDALRFARATLTAYLERREPPVSSRAAPALHEHRAAFVTLRVCETGALRGCRGEYRPRRPLIESIAEMVIATAIDDPRFPAVEADELPRLLIQISALTSLQPIQPQDVVLGRHGLLISLGALGPALAESAGPVRPDHPRSLPRSPLPEGGPRPRCLVQARRVPVRIRVRRLGRDRLG